MRIAKAEALARAAEERARLPARYDGCAMCALADGHPGDVQLLAARPRAVAVLDRYAARPGHVLVVLRRHVESLARLAWDEYAEVQHLAWQAARALERTVAARRIFVAALGAARPRPISFPHHHVHVVPLGEDGDEDRPARVFSWEPGVIVYAPEEAQALAARLRAAWPADDAASR